MLTIGGWEAAVSVDIDSGSAEDLPRRLLSIFTTIKGSLSVSESTDSGLEPMLVELRDWLLIRSVDLAAIEIGKE
jgi:hypothetical protein